MLMAPAMDDDLSVVHSSPQDADFVGEWKCACHKPKQTQPITPQDGSQEAYQMFSDKIEKWDCDKRGIRSQAIESLKTKVASVLPTQRESAGAADGGVTS